MGEFLNPLSGMAPDRTLTDRELARALRMALSAKQEAVHLHEAIADATDSPLAKAVLQDIANEERVHPDEFLHVLKTLVADEQGRREEGAREVELQRQAEPAAVCVLC